MSSIYDYIAPAYYEPWNDAVLGKVKEMWFPGGRHSGKSVFCAFLIVSLLLAEGNEKCHAVIFRKHQTDLRESVYSEVIQAIRRLGLEHLFTYKTSPLEIKRKHTGQTITFHGLDDPRKHKSKKPPFGYVKVIWAEEMDEFTSWDEIDSVLISYQRLDVNNPDVQADFIFMGSFNPPRSTANWANAETLHKVKGRKVYHTDYRDLAECGWIAPSILEKIEAAKEANLDRYRHVYLGIATGTGGEIFTNIKDQRITDEQIASFRNKGYGMDFGIVNDPTVLEGCCYNTDTDTIYCFQEWSQKHPYFTDVHSALVQRKLNYANVIADSAPAGWVENINKLGANLHKCFKAEDWPETGVSWIRSRKRVIIDSERCPLLWNEMSHYEYDYYSDGTPKEKLPDYDNHGIDALRYALEPIIKNFAHKRHVGVPVGKPRSYGNKRPLF